MVLTEKQVPSDRFLNTATIRRFMLNQIIIDVVAYVGDECAREAGLPGMLSSKTGVPLTVWPLCPCEQSVAPKSSPSQVSSSSPRRCSQPSTMYFSPLRTFTNPPLPPVFPGPRSCLSWRIMGFPREGPKMACFFWGGGEYLLWTMS